MHVDDRWLFTGDSLHWNPRRRRLDVFPDQTWYSWDELADSMDVLAGLPVEWVFTGHGLWHEVGAEVYAEQMAALGTDMRATGRGSWRSRRDPRRGEPPEGPSGGDRRRRGSRCPGRWVDRTTGGPSLRRS